ncbi:class I SAM-dependent methyltransferase [Qipengyuania sp. CAU 1752]
MAQDSKYPALDRLAERVGEAWPEHRQFIETSLVQRTMRCLSVSDDLSRAILTLADAHAGGLDALIADYRFLCEDIVLPEELHFRRHGSYRLSSFAEVEREVYANAEFMGRYLNGLLVSNVLWANHAAAFDAFANDYLPGLPDDCAHLEVGPGHGMLMCFAERSPQVASITGWDISPASIAKTRTALDTLHVTKPVDLRLQDLFAADDAPAGGFFDSIVLSEILEHLEDPVAALKAVSHWLRPGGQVWINVPANSPAPDHIFLFEGLDHAATIARNAGLDVLDARAFPMTGATLERAQAKKLTITCVVTAQKPTR